MDITTEKKSKSYVAIMDAAKALFWKYGIVKVTVEAICEHAEVSKMTFYRNFDNKKHVAEKVLTAIAAKSMHDYRRIMDSDIPFNKKIPKEIIARIARRS